MEETRWVHIDCGDTQYIAPLEYFDRFAAGEDVEPPSLDMMRKIVKEWRDFLIAGIQHGPTCTGEQSC